MHKEPQKKYQLSGKGSSSEAMGLPEWGLGLMPICFWGTAFYFVDTALREGMHPGTIVWFRMTIGFVFFSLLPVKHKKHSLGVHDWTSIFILGFVGLSLPLTLFAIAQQWVQSSLAGMLVGAQPIFATLLASLLLKTLPTRKNVISLCFGLGGLTIVAWPFLTNFDSQAHGVILVIVALNCYAFSYNFSIPLTQKLGGYFLNVRMLLASSILTAPYGIYGLFQTEHTIPAYYSLLILGIGATAITPYAAARLGAQVGAARASSVNFLIPLVALFMGAAISGDAVEWPYATIGLAVILLGLMSLVTGPDTRYSKKQPPLSSKFPLS